MRKDLERAALAQADRERQKERAQGRSTVDEIRKTATGDGSQHAYVIRKKIKPHGSRRGTWIGADGKRTSNVLIFDIRDIDGNLMGVQGILPSGKKLFVKGAPKKYGFHVIGEESRFNDERVAVFVEGGSLDGGNDGGGSGRGEPDRHRDHQRKTKRRTHQSHLAPYRVCKAFWKERKTRGREFTTGTY